MKINTLLIILVVVFCFSQFILADIPPDPNEMRMRADLIINTDEDLSDYKFFLAFPVDVREVEIKSKGNTSIESSGGGAAFSNGTLFAIPKKKIKEFGGDITPQQIQTLSSYNLEKNIDGVIELGKHQFKQTIKASERANWTYPTYKLEREGNSLKLVTQNQISPKINLEEEAKINGGKYLIATIIAGILIALAILATGIFLFRKVSKKG